jgi:vacuolar-type H+-ATPase subunit H
MEKAKAEAEKIRSSSKKEISNMRKKGKDNIPKAVKEILDVVIPLGNE